MTTATPEARLIVSIGQSECRAVTTARIHHRDYPEMEAVGATETEAAANLANLLIRALDSVPYGFHRATLEQALADLREYVSCNPNP
jgi:hypothetical protein